MVLACPWLTHGRYDRGEPSTELRSPGRVPFMGALAAGPETGVAMRLIVILSFIKVIRAPGIRGPVCPRVPRSIWILEPPVFVEILCVAENIFLDTISSSHLHATSKTLLGFGVLGRCLREG